MKKEDLEAGNKLQRRIKTISERIERLEQTETPTRITIASDKFSVSVGQDDKELTEKTNTNLEYLNKLYRDNVLRTLEDCKKEYKKEFELLGK